MQMKYAIIIEQLRGVFVYPTAHPEERSDEGSRRDPLALWALG